MEEVIRRALTTLGQKGRVTIGGIGEMRRIVGKARSFDIPNPFTGGAMQCAMPERHRLRFEQSAELDAIAEGEPLPRDLRVDPVVREALEALVLTGDASIDGLGTFTRVVIPSEVVEMRNPFTGGVETIERGGTSIRFRRSAALDDVVAGKPIPEQVPDAVLASLLEAYPPEVDWSLELLLEHLARGGRRGKKRAGKKRGPALFASFAPHVGEGMARRARPMLAEGHVDDLFCEVPTLLPSDAVCEVLRDGNGDRWVAEREGDDPATYYVEHEGGDHLTKTGPLSRLLAAWLFHDEAVTAIGDGIASPESRRALDERLAALSEPVSRERGSFAPFRA
jgi:hypothetical protein